LLYLFNHFLLLKDEGLHLYELVAQDTLICSQKPVCIDYIYVITA